MNMKKTIATSISVLALMLFALAVPVQSSITAGDITGGVIAPHVNIAIFHKLHGQEGFTYPAKVASDDILKSMAGKAQFISINHTAGLKDGDVITIGNDVLRESAGNFEDFGVDCQLNVHIKADNVTVAGICQLLMLDQNNRQIEHKGIIKPTEMQPNQGWILLYSNAEDGIAVYADQEIGIE